MGGAPDLAVIKAACRIEDVIRDYQVTVTPSGAQRLVGLCPFHKERRPSFTVYLATQSFCCYGCNRAGDVITFVQYMQGGPERCSFQEALAALGGGQVAPARPVLQQGNARLRETPETALHHPGRAFAFTLAAAIYMGSLGGVPDVHVYLRTRGISLALARRCGLGYADGVTFPGLIAGSPSLQQQAQEWGLLNRRGRDLLVQRLVIPEMRDGRVVQMIGRAIPTFNAPLASITYLGTTRLKSVLGYGHACERLQAGQARGVLVVEGALDYVIATGWDLPVACVALCSTGASPFQIGELAELYRMRPEQPLLIALDGDDPGQTATPHLLADLQTAQVPAVAVPPIPGATDIGDLGPLRAIGRQRLLAVVQPLLTGEE